MNHTKHRGKQSRGSSGRTPQPRGYGRPGRTSPAILQDTPDLNVYDNMAATFGIIQLLGLLVELQTKDGHVFEGLLKHISPEMNVTLEYARKTTPANSHPKAIEDIIVFPWPNVVDIHAADMDNLPVCKDSFTDTSISKCNGQYKEKRLEAWQGEDIIPDGEDWQCSEGNDQNGLEWNMFQVNKDRFGVESSFDERMLSYTTPIKKDGNPDFERQQEEATRIAREIEQGKGYARNSRTDSRTEEERFSSVVREETSIPRVEQDPSNDPSPRSSSKKAMSPVLPAQSPPPPEMQKTGPPGKVSMLDKSSKPNNQNEDQPDLEELKNFSTNFMLKTEEPDTEFKESTELAPGLGEPTPDPEAVPPDPTPPAAAEAADAPDPSPEASPAPDLSILEKSTLNPNAMTFCPTFKQESTPPPAAQAYPPPTISPVPYGAKVGPGFPIYPLPVQAPVYRGAKPFTKPNVPRGYFGPDTGEPAQAVMSAAQATGSPIIAGPVPGYVPTIPPHQMPGAFIPPPVQYGQGQVQNVQMLFPGTRFPASSPSPYPPEAVYGGQSTPQASPSQQGTFLFQPTLVGQPGGAPPQANIASPPQVSPAQGGFYRPSVSPYAQRVPPRPQKYGGHYGN